MHVSQAGAVDTNLNSDGSIEIMRKFGDNNSNDQDGGDESDCSR